MTAIVRRLSMVLLIAPGCGESASFQNVKSPLPSSAAPAAPASAGERYRAADAREPAAPGSEPIKSVPRKIIYTAEVDLVTEDFARAEAEVARLVQQFEGYLAQAEVTGSPGQPRSGRWKARVPVARFESFLAAVVGLGELTSRKTDSQDVTEEFYDLEARLKTKKVEEERLLKHLEDSTGSLKDILEVERELSRVRGEIEQQEGRLRLLANLTDLTTVTIVIQEQHGYVPPQAPSFRTDLARTFRASLDTLIALGKSLVRFVVAIAPWVPLLIAAALVLRWIGRRRRGSYQSRPPAA